MRVFACVHVCVRVCARACVRACATALFPEALAREENVKLAFTRALDMMNNVVAGAQIVGKYVQEGVQENLQYLKVTEGRSKDKDGGRGVGSGRVEAKPVEKPKISIADAMYNNSVRCVRVCVCLHAYVCVSGMCVCVFACLRRVHVCKSARVRVRVCGTQLSNGHGTADSEAPPPFEERR